MDLDDLLFRYFGTTDMWQVPPSAQIAGIERIEVDFWLATDRGHRFALWALLHMLGSAPDLDVAFKDAGDREAARNFLDLLAATGDG
ncbi:hypothetical protein [Novosphingobium sp. Gsoil 351]|uniref:hypothetical protein n=1 Tax=Novosphingobium sp. Gsoil 351 TaxID=2675225 RepID=UPI0012B503DA|nr:hypothetical protein [Novosphingobium sp. Gsoil 351]QGN55045.1 hypothetical protein GKE62_11235 [Novosphingobium sp. Gsoil 351]